MGHILYGEEDYSKSAMLSNLKLLEKDLQKENYDFQTIGEMLERFMRESDIQLEQFDDTETKRKLNGLKEKLDSFNKTESVEEFLELKKIVFL